MRDDFPLAWLRQRFSVLRQRWSVKFQHVWRTAAPKGTRALRIITETGRKLLDWLQATPWQAIALRRWKLFLEIGAVILLIVIWKVPQWQAAGWQGLMEPKDLAKLQNEVLLQEWLVI